MAVLWVLRSSLGIAGHRGRRWLGTGGRCTSLRYLIYNAAKETVAIATIDRQKFALKCKGFLVDEMDDYSMGAWDEIV